MKMHVFFQVSIVLDVVSRIRTNQETDFHELFSTISFINHCTPEESITATDKASLYFQLCFYCGPFPFSPLCSGRTVFYSKTLPVVDLLS